MDEMIEKVKNGYTLNIYKDKLELSTAVFKFIESHIIHTLKKEDRFQFCVSGGSTPKSVYKLLSKSNLRWDMVDVFLGDERCVDPNSELSNSLMLRNSLLTNFGSKAYFYEIFNDLNADDETTKNQFISKLFEKCGSNPPTFDLTLLGLGDDGHTASLFPYQKNNNIDDFVNFDGVLSGGSFSSNNLSRAILLEAPLTKNTIFEEAERTFGVNEICLLYTSPSPRD